MNPLSPVSELVDALVQRGAVKHEHRGNLESLFFTRGKYSIGDVQSTSEAEWPAFNLPPGLVRLIRATAAGRTKANPTAAGGASAGQARGRTAPVAETSVRPSPQIYDSGLGLDYSSSRLPPSAASGLSNSASRSVYDTTPSGSNYSSSPERRIGIHQRGHGNLKAFEAMFGDTTIFGDDAPPMESEDDRLKALLEESDFPMESDLGMAPPLDDDGGGWAEVDNNFGAGFMSGGSGSAKPSTPGLSSEWNSSGLNELTEDDILASVFGGASSSASTPSRANSTPSTYSNRTPSVQHQPLSPPPSAYDPLEELIGEELGDQYVSQSFTSSSNKFTTPASVHPQQSASKNSYPSLDDPYSMMSDDFGFDPAEFANEDTGMKFGTPDDLPPPMSPPPPTTAPLSSPFALSGPPPTSSGPISRGQSTTAAPSRPTASPPAVYSSPSLRAGTEAPPSRPKTDTPPARPNAAAPASANRVATRGGAVQPQPPSQAPPGYSPVNIPQSAPSGIPPSAANRVAAGRARPGSSPAGPAGRPAPPGSRGAPPGRGTPGTASLSSSPAVPPAIEALRGTSSTPPSQRSSLNDSTSEDDDIGALTSSGNNQSKGKINRKFRDSFLNRVGASMGGMGASGPAGGVSMFGGAGRGGFALPGLARPGGPPPAVAGGGGGATTENPKAGSDSPLTHPSKARLQVQRPSRRPPTRAVAQSASSPSILSVDPSVSSAEYSYVDANSVSSASSLTEVLDANGGSAPLSRPGGARRPGPPRRAPGGAAAPASAAPAGGPPGGAGRSPAAHSPLRGYPSQGHQRVGSQPALGQSRPIQGGGAPVGGRGAPQQRPPMSASSGQVRPPGAYPGGNVSASGSPSAGRGTPQSGPTAARGRGRGAPTGATRPAAQQAYPTSIDDEYERMMQELNDFGAM